MPFNEMRSLGSGYAAEVDTSDEQNWSRILREFEDANIYQTWSYTAVIAGRRKTSHLILRKNNTIVALALVRIAKIPLIKAGVAYVRWGPLWRPRDAGLDDETFRQALRALRNEFVCKRRLVLRVFPMLFESESSLKMILDEEGYSSRSNGTSGETILMDLRCPLDQLRQGMKPHCKRELKIAERKGLVVEEGSEDELFAAFLKIYREMVSRKRFIEGNDINQFRLMQSELPETLKMRIMLCKSCGGDTCAGLIYSAIGNTAIYLFGATSTDGMKSRGSYLLQWLLLDRLKENHVTLYNLNGINPARNPRGYKFKNDFAGDNGTNVSYIGRFDAHASTFGYCFVESADRLRGMFRVLWAIINNAREIMRSVISRRSPSIGS